MLEIPGGLDPDEYIQQFGVDEYRKLLQERGFVFSLAGGQSARANSICEPRKGRVDAFNFLLPSIQQVSDRLERSAIARDVAEYLNVDRDMVMQNYKRAAKAQPANSRRGRYLPRCRPMKKYCWARCWQARTRARQFAITWHLRVNLPLLEAGDIFEAVAAVR